MPSSSNRKAGDGASSSKRARSSKSGGEGGSLSAIEKRIWQTAQECPNAVITSDKLPELFSDVDLTDVLVPAVNSLLRKSLLVAQQGASGLQYMAVSKADASMMGSMEGDEGIIYRHIKQSGNEGIWTRQLKMRSNLHQTVMARCLKSLEQRQLIKVVKSVKFPTRKIYMLYNMTPSVELSGGPWYTDNELDTVFIESLCRALYQYISHETWPLQLQDRDEAAMEKEGNPTRLFPASHTPDLPSAQSCLKWLRDKKLTPTKLAVKDVKSLLDTLVWDGKIEKVPCLPNSSIETRSRKKSSSRHRSTSLSDDSKSGSESGSGSGDESGSEIGSESGSGSGSDSGSEMESESDDEDGKRSTSKRKRSSNGRSKSASRKKKRSSSSRKSKSSSKRSKSKDRSSRSRSRSRSRSKSVSNGRSRRKTGDMFKGVGGGSIALTSDDDGIGSAGEDDDLSADEDEMAWMDGSSAFVYRAIRPFYVRPGWTETTCGHCPVFDFCEQGGPVNAERCVYMGEWIVRSGRLDRDREEGEDEDESDEAKKKSKAVNGRDSEVTANGAEKGKDKAEKSDDGEDEEPTDDAALLSGFNMPEEDYDDDDQDH
ncbi:hypothetical protein L7F22_058829 [Adiantum nelumboides]|nr:hypothetical protein [Adiantum nelumboides]